MVLVAPITVTVTGFYNIIIIIIIIIIITVF